MRPQVPLDGIIRQAAHRCARCLLRAKRLSMGHMKKSTQQRTRKDSPVQPADPAQGSSHYRDRPADDGKHGDGAQEPTPALPGAGNAAGRAGSGARGTRRKP